MKKSTMQTIRELREERGWTQLQLGNMLGVTPVTVYNWERGQHMPTAPQLRALARAFGVSMDAINFEGPVEAKSAA
jgi:transcriptional regulator with XRE-family HTH domain